MESNLLQYLYEDVGLARDNELIFSGTETDAGKTGRDLSSFFSFALLL